MIQEIIEDCKSKNLFIETDIKTLQEFLESVASDTPFREGKRLVIEGDDGKKILMTVAAFMKINGIVKPFNNICSKIDKFEDINNYVTITLLKSKYNEQIIDKLLFYSILNEKDIKDEWFRVDSEKLLEHLLKYCSKESPMKCDSKIEDIEKLSLNVKKEVLEKEYVRSGHKFKYLSSLEDLIEYSKFYFYNSKFSILNNDKIMHVYDKMINDIREECNK